MEDQVGNDKLGKMSYKNKGKCGRKSRRRRHDELVCEITEKHLREKNKVVNICSTIVAHSCNHFAVAKQCILCV
jgi:hypothetical protein